LVERVKKISIEILDKNNFEKRRKWILI